MIFAETELKGVFTVEVDKLVDARGFFGRVWCEQELRGQDLNPRIAQCSISFNHKRGTFAECTTRSRRTKRQSWFVVQAGAIYDVVLDLRSDSPTYTQWTAVELTALNRRMLYIPENCAHGFTDSRRHTEVFYLISQV